MTDWTLTALRGLITTNAKSISKNYPFNEIKYLDTASITCNKISELQGISLTDAPSRAKRLVSHNEIVYSTVRPNLRHYGIIRNPPDNLVVSTGFVTIICNNQKLDPYFFYSYLTQKSITDYLHSIAEGSTTTYPSLKPSDLLALDIVLPPIEEQKAIAEVLSSIDDKIDLLNRQNETLEAMAQTLFRQWFIEGADDRWEEYQLSELCALTKTPINPAATPTQIFEHYSLPSYDDSKTPTFDTGISIKSNKYRVENGCVLISKLNPGTSRVWLVKSEASENSICSTEFVILKPKDSSALLFTYCLLRTKDTTDFLSGCASGTSGSHQRVKPKDILDLTFCIRNKAQLKSFDGTVSPLFEKVSNNRNTINSLKRMRDTLLPKLMSGEVRVKLD